MKSKKQRNHSSQPEECGVWLDTGELKKRSHQTFIPCTYSNRFNPLLRRPHVDSATIEFTQTKTPQICTKQTSMYSFFTTKDKVATPTSQANLTNSPCAQERPEDNDAEHLNLGSSTDYVDESSACRSTILCNPENNIQPSAQLWKDIYDDCSTVTSSLIHPKDLLQSHSEQRTENMRCSPANFCASGTTKKHSISLLDSSINSHCPDVHEKDVYTDSQIDIQLFTQDSQGNRVIAHRAASNKQKTRCPSGPLQDRTNVPWDTGSPMKRSHQNLCDEDSLRFLFTQDSEGNMVIKH